MMDDLSFTIIVHESMMNEENKQKYQDWTGGLESKDSILIESSHGYRIEEITIQSRTKRLSPNFDIMLSHGEEDKGVFLSLSIPIYMILAKMIQEGIIDKLQEDTLFYYNEGKKILDELLNKQKRVRAKKTKEN